MTEIKANEYFRQKYPNGEIKRKYSTSLGYKYWVVFDNRSSNPKVYSYSATSYVEVLKKVGFKIMYKHTFEQYKKTIEKLKNEIETGGWYDEFGFYSDELDGFVEYSDAEIEEKKKELAWLENEIATSIIE